MVTWTGATTSGRPRQDSSTAPAAARSSWRDTSKHTANGAPLARSGRQLHERPRPPAGLTRRGWSGSLMLADDDDARRRHFCPVGLLARLRRIRALARGIGELRSYGFRPGMNSYGIGRLVCCGARRLTVPILASLSLITKTVLLALSAHVITPWRPLPERLRSPCRSLQVGKCGVQRPGSCPVGRQGSKQAR